MDVRVPIYARYNGQDIHVGDFEMDVTMTGGLAVVDCAPLVKLLEDGRNGSTTWNRKRAGEWPWPDRPEPDSARQPYLAQEERARYRAQEDRARRSGWD